MPSLVATTSTPARKPFVRTHYVRTNKMGFDACIYFQSIQKIDFRSSMHPPYVLELHIFITRRKSALSLQMSLCVVLLWIFIWSRTWAFKSHSLHTHKVFMLLPFTSLKMVQTLHFKVTFFTCFFLEDHKVPHFYESSDGPGPEVSSHILYIRIKSSCFFLSRAFLASFLKTTKFHTIWFSLNFSPEETWGAQ